MLFCHEISLVASYAPMVGGDSQKVMSNDEGSGGVTISPQNDDVIYEQPVLVTLRFWIKPFWALCW